MLTFWDTIRGHEMADTLIRELPKLNKNMNRRQYVDEYPQNYAKDDMLKKTLEAKMQDGYHLDQILPSEDKFICIWSR